MPVTAGVGSEALQATQRALPTLLIAAASSCCAVNLGQQLHNHLDNPRTLRGVASQFYLDSTFFWHHEVSK